MRYGIIGSGMMGAEHIRSIALIDGATVTAVADPNEQMRLAALSLAGPACRGFTSYADLLAANCCDALVIATPNDTHHAVLLDTLPTDLPILVEKPLCATPAQCEEIAQITNYRNAPVWVAMEYRYMPPVARLLATVREGVAGDIKMISASERRFPFLKKVGNWNRFNDRTGGTMIEKCCHFFDLFRLIAGSEATRVYASGGMDVNFLDENYAGRKPDVIDNAFVIVDFANGIRAMLELCMFAEGSTWQEVIVATGDIGQVTAKVPAPKRFTPDNHNRVACVAIAKRATKTEIIEEMPIDQTILAAGDHYGSCFFQHRHFLAMLSSQGAPEVSVADGMAAVRIGDAAEQSAKSGQVIAL